MILSRHLLVIIFILNVAGCSFLEASGEAVGVVGKAGWSAGKAVGGAVYTGSSMAGQTANQTNKTLVRDDGKAKASTVSMEGRRIKVPLERDGKSFFVRLKLNKTTSARFMLDTGASAVQVSKAMAKKLKLRAQGGQTIPVMLASGGYVRGHVVDINEVAIGPAKVHNVKAIVLDQDNIGLNDGLLGMSFLENFIFSIDTQKGQLILEKR